MDSRGSKLTPHACGLFAWTVLLPEVVVVKYVEQRKEWSQSGDAGALPECEMKKLMTPLSMCAALGGVELELFVFLRRHLHWMLQEGHDSLSIQPVGCTPSCSTDAICWCSTVSPVMALGAF